MHTLQRIVLLLVAGVLIGAAPALAQDDTESEQMTSAALESFFPESLGEASLEQVETQEDRRPRRAAEVHGESNSADEPEQSESDPDLRARGLYTHPDVDGSLSLALAYGKIVEEGVMQISSLQMMASSEGDDWHAEDWEIQGHPVHFISVDGRAVAASLIDQFVVVITSQETNDAALFRTMFEDYDLNTLASWEAPGSYTAHSLGDDTCLSIACFAERVSACESGQMMGQLSRRLGGVYVVEEPTDDGQCLLSFAFTDNPNPDFTDKKVFFSVNQGADVAANFREDIMTPMKACMEESEEASEHCGGPLLEMMDVEQGEDIEDEAEVDTSGGGPR